MPDPHVPLKLVIKAIKLMKSGKSAGTCLIVAETLEVSGDAGIQQICDLVEAETPGDSGDEGAIQIHNLVEDIIFQGLSLLFIGRY